MLPASSTLFCLPINQALKLLELTSFCSAGSRDSPLTNHGIFQARRLGAHLASRSSTIGPVHTVFSSNLQRAVKTAEAVANAQAGIAGVDDVPAVWQLADLREKDFGSEEGKRFGTRRQSVGPGVGVPARPVDWFEPESREAMQLRVDRFIQAHFVPTVRRGFDSDANHSVVVVAHGIILNTLLRCLLAQFGPEELTRLSRPGDPSGRPELLVSWSNTGYLEANLRLARTGVGKVSAGSRSFPAPVPPGTPANTSLATAGVGQVGAPAFAIRMTVQTINCNHHLAGLKKTRGGIGSTAFDPKQKTMDSMFSRAAKKPKLDNDGDAGSSGSRG